jgi:uncharacterized protein (DUF1697 family)
MSTFVALFRAINVGGKNKLPMRDLVTLVEGLGAQDTATYIQSGNLVFRAPASTASGLVHNVRKAIHSQFGFKPELILLDGPAIETTVANNPFPQAVTEPTSVHVTFLSDRPHAPDLDALEALRKPSERFVLDDERFYLYAPDGIARSRLAGRIERSLGVPGTSRNWRTVVKLQQMVRERTG